MTTVRMLPAHEIVRRTYPRPAPQERDQVAMAIGKAIDGTLTECGFQLRQGRRPTQTAMTTLAGALLNEALAEAAVAIGASERETTLRQVQEVLRAYRRSEIAGLSRPRTRVFLIGGKVGVYAQPDYWDGRNRFFEMKTYRAIPPPPDVALQLRLFQLAFPTFRAVLVCLDRHTSPVEATSLEVPPPSRTDAEGSLRLAYDLGHQFGEEKVLEYLDGPVVHYEVPPGDGEAPPTGRGPTEPTSRLEPESP